MDVNYEIVPKVLDFKPFFNSKYSFVNDPIYKRTGVDLGMLFHIIQFSLLWGIIYILYRFF